MKRLAFVAVALAAVVAVAAQAQGNGVGGVLKRDCVSYKHAARDAPQYHLRAGTFCAFMTYSGGWGNYKEKDGFIRILVFPDNSGGSGHNTWVEVGEVELFNFTGATRSSGGLMISEPTVAPVEGAHAHWTLGFRMAAAAKCKELGIEPAAGTIYLEEPAK